MKQIIIVFSAILFFIGCSVERGAGKDSSLASIVNALLTPAADADVLISRGFKFILVVTKNGEDTVLVNQKAADFEFTLADSVCHMKIQSKKDSVYQGETLGVLSLECKNHGIQSISSASCSQRFPEAQNHVEIKDDKDSFVMDLICRLEI